LIRLFRDLGGVDWGQQAPGYRYVTGSGQADSDSGLSEECCDAVGSIRVGFELAPAPSVNSGALLELIQPDAFSPERLRDGRHDSSRVCGGLVNVGGNASAANGNLPEPLRKISLPYTGIAMNIKEEAAPLVVCRQTKIVLKLDHLPLATDETTLLPASDLVLQRRPVLSHLRFPDATFQMPSSGYLP
jgi:hypothetical protein